MKKIVLTSAVCVALIELAAPAVADDARNGAQLAQVWCANCHLVPGVSGGPALQGPPSFRTIAHDSKTPDQLRAFLEQPHGAMPQLSLSRAEIADLLAYIASLR